MHGIISIFFYFLSLLCALGYDLFWRRFHGLLRRMYIVHKLDEMFCRYQVGPFDLLHILDLGFLYGFFVWMTYLLMIMGVKVSHNHCVGVNISF
jgi:hypothetical protein